MQRLAFKVALVAGSAAAGVRKVIARRLRAEGATFVISDIQVELGRATVAEARYC